jgi:lactate dehydrogenase-like 2-hydroxyacid dehydrogenase
MKNRVLAVSVAIGACAIATVPFNVKAADSAASGVIQHYGLEQAETPVKERKGWRKPKRILLGGFASQTATVLQSAAPDVEFVVAGSPEAKAKLASVDAAIGVCNAELLAAAKSIQWIQMVTAGVENCVSVPAVKERNILVTNMQRVAGPVIAEHVIAMAMALTRGLDV